MTVEERAQDVMSIFRCMLIETIDGQVLTGIDLMDRIAQALRDQIEGNARHCDREVARLIELCEEYTNKKDLAGAARMSAAAVCVAKVGRELRALAEPKPETEGKGGVILDCDLSA
jgi:hypothetical protein